MKSLLVYSGIFWSIVAVTASLMTVTVTPLAASIAIVTTYMSIGAVVGFIAALSVAAWALTPGHNRVE